MYTRMKLLLFFTSIVDLSICHMFLFDPAS